MMIKPNAARLVRDTGPRFDLRKPLVSVILAVFLPAALGYLIVAGHWQVAAVLLLAAPAGIILVRYPFLGVILWLALAPFVTVVTPSLQQAYWLIYRLLPLAALVIILVNNTLKLQEKKIPGIGPAEQAMAAYLLASIASILILNDKPGDTLQLLYDRVFIPMVLYSIIRLWSPSQKDLQRLTFAIFLMVISQVVIGLLAWFYPSVLPNQWLEWAGQRTTGTLRSYGAFAAAMIFGGLLLLHTALQGERVPFRKLYLSVFFLSIFGAFISFSRAGWLATGAVLAGLFFLYPKSALRTFIILLPVVILLAAGPLAGQVEWASERLDSEESEASALSRLPTYLASLRMIQAKPLFGWGYENFNRYDFQFYRRVGDLVNPDKDHSSHNFFLTLLAEQGILGFMLFLFPFGYWFSLTAKTMHTMPLDGFFSRKFTSILWLFLLGFLILNLFQSMRVPYALGLMWVCLGLLGTVISRFYGQDSASTFVGSSPATQQETYR